MTQLTLTTVQKTVYVCPLCGKEFQTADEGAEHAKLGFDLPDYRIGDRVKFHTSKTSQYAEGYQKPEGTIINLMIEKSLETLQYLARSEHLNYLFRYQIRTDSGHIYENILHLEMMRACESTQGYERGKKIFTPAEFIKEMKQDPCWNSYIIGLNEY